MLKYKIILALFLIALVFTRANVFAQRIDVVDYGLLTSGFDSVIDAHKLHRDSVEIIFDSLDSKVFPSTPIHFICDSLVIIKVAGYRKIYGSSPLPQGQNYVSVSGELRYKDRTKSKEFFSFEKSSNFLGACAFEPNENDKSFWDSTAKPILVTLGAVAVIALFFLIRG